jgi:hypothetical protein
LGVAVAAAVAVAARRKSLSMMSSGSTAATPPWPGRGQGSRASGAAHSITFRTTVPCKGAVSSVQPSAAAILARR